MILYGSTLSPFVRKVMAFANEKNVSLELRPAGMGRGGPEFADASPFGKMPAFRDPGEGGDGGFAISDSSAIVQYLEAKFPEPNLIPVDPANRARTIWFEEFADTILGKLVSACFFNRVVAPRFLNRAGDEAAADQAERDELPPVMDYLERVAPGAGGFLVAERTTLADIAVASALLNLSHARVNLDPARWPRTGAYLAAILARPSFAPIVARECAVLSG